MFKALIFDMDGTLVDSERVHCRAWSETLSSYGISAPPFEEFGRYVGVSDESMAVEFVESGGLDVGPDRLLDEKRARYRSLTTHIPLLAGVNELLGRCNSVYPMAVASSSPHGEVMRILEQHGLKALFEHIVGGDMVANKKPDPEIYLKTAGLLGVEPESCLAFEDSGAGVAAARSAGMKVVAVPQHVTVDHDFSDADVRVASLLEVDDALLVAVAGKRG